MTTRAWWSRRRAPVMITHVDHRYVSAVVTVILGSERFDCLPALLDRDPGSTPVVYVPTAADVLDDQAYVQEETRRLAGMGFQITELKAPELATTKAMELVSFSVLAHYGDPNRAERHRQLLAAPQPLPIVPVSDAQLIVVRGSRRSVIPAVP